MASREQTNSPRAKVVWRPVPTQTLPSANEEPKRRNPNKLDDNTNCIKLRLLNPPKAYLEIRDDEIVELISQYPPKEIHRDAPSEWILSFNTPKEAFCCERDFNNKPSPRKRQLCISIIKQTLTPIYTISDVELKKLPILYTPLAKNVHLVTNNKDVEAAITALLNGQSLDTLKTDDNHILGMDIEIRPAFKKGQYYRTSLIQLSSKNVTALFHLTFLPEFPLLLKQLLESDLVLKAGVGLNSDIGRLKNDFNINCNNIADIRDVPVVSRCRPGGLKGLSAVFCNVKLQKKWATSNWDLELNSRQIAYAANDAYLSREIYLKVKSLYYDPYE